MKIYFTASTAELEKNASLYENIRTYLLESGHILTRDWLLRAKQRMLNKVTDIYDIKEIYQACMKAISEADLVIIEDTVSNFSTGHQITIALQQKKPTLVLWQGKKHKHFNQMFIHGVESEFLEIYEYTSKNLTDILQLFIRKYSHFSARNRFHLVLNAAERQYLDWLQFTKHRSRTKVIRQALQTEIKNDEEYSEYLKRK